MTTCEPCTIRESGDDLRAHKAEAIRAQNLLIAYLKGDGATLSGIATELNSCPECQGRLLAHYLGQTGEALTQISGGREAAVKAAEMTLSDLKAGNL